MRCLCLFVLLGMSLLAPSVQGACAPLRIGYVNQHRPPYFIGSGSAEAARPGATVELLREAGASASCAVTGVRLPALRLRPALEAGTIDAMLLDVDADAGNVHRFALPLDATGQPDKGRGLPMFTMVFVRAADRVPPDTDPAVYFRSHTLGLNNGASIAGRLRKEGLHVDDGAADAERNLEKLVRGRVDGYAAIMVSPTAADARLTALYGARLQRLDTPLRTQYFWLVFTKAYQAANRAGVDTMWSWLGLHGRERFVALIKQYEDSR